MNVEVETRLEYQPALDGLRGVAVLGVFLYHQPFTPDLLPGGFLGVDLFFVLSGYLITSLLLVDHERTGKVVSWSFWARRARRLLPALAVFFALIAVYAVWFAPGYYEHALRSGGLAAIFYVYNWWQIRSHGTPLYVYGHLWSLSVEEQFYLVWPFVLGALLWLARGRRRLVALYAALLAFVSVVAMWGHHVTGHGEAAYIGTDSRAHTVLAGALLAILLHGRRVPAWARLPLEVAAMAASAWIAWLMWTAGPNSTWLYRGGFAFVALAVAVVIAAATDPTSRLVRPVLSWTPLRWIGIVSYGVYLFHLPLMAMVDAHVGHLHGVGLLSINVAVTAAVACLSFFLVERPVRRQRVRVGWLAAVTATATTVALLMVATLGASPISASELMTINFQQFATTSHVRVLAVGDVLTSSWGNGVDVDGIRGVTATAPGCSIDDSPVMIGARVLPSRSCDVSQSAVTHAALAGFQPAYVVVGLGPSAVFDRYVAAHATRLGTPEFTKHLAAVLDDLRREVRVPTLIATVPCMNPPLTGRLAAFSVIERDARRLETVNRDLTDYAVARRLRVVDVNGIVCRDGVRRPGMASLGGVGLSGVGAEAVWRAVGLVIGQRHL